MGKIKKPLNNIKVLVAGANSDLFDQYRGYFWENIESRGAEIDYQEGLEGAQFVIKNPNAKTTCGCGSSFST